MKKDTCKLSTDAVLKTQGLLDKGGLTSIPQSRSVASPQAFQGLFLHSHLQKLPS